MKADEIKNVGPFSMVIPGNEEGKMEGMTWSDSMMLTQTKYEGWRLPNEKECLYILEMYNRGILGLKDTLFWTSIRADQFVIIFKPGEKITTKVFSSILPGHKLITILIKNNWQ
jgi:hypothetical protein